MPVAESHLLALSDEQRQVLETWLVEFDHAWDEQRLAAWLRKLPPASHPLRRPALIEMVKIDLERHWQRGNRLGLENYLKNCPELGTADTVPPDLIHAEWHVRQQFGATAELADFEKRFPRQADELRRLIAPPSNDGGTRHGLQASKATQIPSPSTFGQMKPPTSSPVLPEEFGRYRILKRLGQGGMGAVYLAEDRQLDRQVALKVPHFTKADGPAALERFYREAKAAATISHPNICPVHDVGEVQGIHYLTMAYVEGKPLSAFIDPSKPLPQRQAAVLIRKLALALHEAHRRGVIHRDLKPSNVIINQRREPVIMDFGLARRVDKQEVRLTKSGSVLGTPAYMPPEQVGGDVNAMGPACDIYSLGVILYELLCGRLPFEGPLFAVVGQIITQEPEPPSKHRTDLDPQLDAICRKAMAKKAAERYASMAEFAAAITDYLRPSVQPLGSPAKPADGSPPHPALESHDAHGDRLPDSVDSGLAELPTLGVS